MTLFIIIFAASLLFLFFAFCFVCYKFVFAHSKRLNKTTDNLPSGKQYDRHHTKIKELIDGAYKLPYEEIYIKSFDGKRLFGRYYEVSKNAPVQILFHGYRSHAIRDFCGGLQFDLDMGFNVLLVDQRAHGKSGGRAITFGVLERHDCLAWANYIDNRFGGKTPIIITGMSMGAATVLMASDLKLPQSVKGIIADCGFTSPKDIICKVIKNRNYPVKFMYFFVRLGGIIYGGFDIQKSSATLSLAKTNIPVLFIHGEADRFVPCEMSRQNHSVCRSTKQILTVNDAAHGMSYLVDTNAYCKAVTEFLNNIKAI